MSGVEDNDSNDSASPVDDVASSDDPASDKPLTVIPPREESADDEESTDASSTESGSAIPESESDSGLTVVPSVTTESQADQDALAQTGAAQVLVMLGIVVSLGVLGTTLIVARRRHA